MAYYLEEFISDLGVVDVFEHGKGYPPQFSALGNRRTIISHPRGRGFNQAVGPVDVLMCLVIVHWALSRTSVWGPGGGVFFPGHGFKVD